VKLVNKHLPSQEEAVDLNKIIKRILKEKLPYASGLFHEYRGKYLADDSLSDVDVLLLCLHIGGEYKQAYEIEYELAKDIFVNLGRKKENFRKAVYSSRKKGYIDKKDKKLIILVKGVKRLEKILGQLHKVPVFIIKSGEHFTAIKKFERFLLEEIEDEEIWLCDPYLAPSTLFPFTIMKGRIRKINILTSNIQEIEKFKNYKKRLEKETGIKVEVKINRKIHDRYIIAGEKCWWIGTSLKDLGNKDTVIKEVSEVWHSLKQLFIERWNEGETFG